MAGGKRPHEVTVVVQLEVNPWRYPPLFDFQYGDWLRKDFEEGKLTPWSTKEMPDLAILIAQILLASQTLMGALPQKVFDRIPTKDFFCLHS